MVLGGEIMTAKVALRNRLKAALSSEADGAGEIRSALHEWRVEVLSVLSIVIAVAALPLISGNLA